MGPAAGTGTPGRPNDAAATSEGADEDVRPQRDADVNQLADRFMSELSANVQRQPAPLPVAYRPMADAITGGRSMGVKVSTDAASRRALRKVGKVAATTDNVIHLADAPAPSARMNEVIAHELTHIAHPSPVARFFDDVDDSPEERQAERVARVMAASPIAPTAPTVASGGSSGSGDTIRRSPRSDDVVRRTPAAGTTSSARRADPDRPSSPGTVSAAALAASITGTPAADPTVQRVTDVAAPPAPATSSGSAGSRPPSSSSSSNGGAPSDDTIDSDEWFLNLSERNLDRLLALIEDRLIVEMERRGNRFWRTL